MDIATETRLGRAFLSAVPYLAISPLNQTDRFRLLTFQSSAFVRGEIQFFGDSDIRLQYKLLSIFFFFMEII